MLGDKQAPSAALHTAEPTTNSQDGEANRRRTSTPSLGSALAPRADRPLPQMLRKGLVLDLSVAFGLGTACGYFWWYGFHIPHTRRRDIFYAGLEDERAKALGQV
ncbi:Cytochrome c oxidase subunit 7A [Teratosphaeriaceae sp. CCFEE 6253]|nr:Cytochrome c oxidase subunit 7A [Teratosphaeriaceae sp. CCFEE 6253]